MLSAVIPRKAVPNPFGLGFRAYGYFGFGSMMQHTYLYYFFNLQNMQIKKIMQQSYHTLANLAMAI